MVNWFLCLPERAGWSFELLEAQSPAVSCHEDHEWAQGQNRVQVVLYAVSIRIMLWWQRLVFSISGTDEIPRKGQWTSSWIRGLINHHVLPVKARNKNVPDCSLGLWVLHCLQVLRFWAIVPSEVYFCCNFPSISWKLAFWCTEQHHHTKLIANSSRAKRIVYFSVVAVHMIYLVIWKTTVWESQEPLWCEKQNRRKCYSSRMRVCLLQTSICA